MATVISCANGALTSSSTWYAASTAGQQFIWFWTSLTGTDRWAAAVSGTDTIDGLLCYVTKNATSAGSIHCSIDTNNDQVAEQTVVCSIDDFNFSHGVNALFFKFGSPVAMSTATRISFKTSPGGTNIQIGVVGNTGWAWFGRKANTYKPIAGDVLYIVSEITGLATSTSYTIIIDEVSPTDYGAISLGWGCTLKYGTNSSTNYYLKTSGTLSGYGGANLYLGEVGASIPCNSSAILEFDCTSDGEFGLSIDNECTFKCCGNERTAGKKVIGCLATTTLAINGTYLTVDTDTGWLDNDKIGIATSSKIFTECENGTLNGTANATGMFIDGFAGTGGGFLYSHAVTGTMSPEVVLLTRNVQIRSASGTFMTYVALAGTHDVRWTEFYYLGTITSNKRGVEVDSVDTYFQYCSLHDSETYLMYIDNGTANISYTGFYKGNTVISAGLLYFSSNTKGTYYVDNCYIIYASTPGSGTIGAILYGSDSTFTNNRIAGCASKGVKLDYSASFGYLYPMGSFDNNNIHGNGGYGLSIESIPSNSPTISNLFAWMNGTSGIYVGQNLYNITFNNLTCLGNDVSHIRFNSSVGGKNVIFNNCEFDSLVGATTTNGILLSAGSFLEDCYFRGCNFGSTVGHTNDFTLSGTSPMSFFNRVIMNNCLLNSSIEIAGTNYLKSGEYFKLARNDRTINSHKTLFYNGYIDVDNVNYYTTNPSQRLNPSSATYKLESGSKKVAVNSGEFATITVWVRQSSSAAGDNADYNGNAPRLIIKRNDSIGIYADTVIDTMSVAIGTWEQLSGIAPTTIEYGVYEVKVDSDGTTGFINIDAWGVT